MEGVCIKLEASCRVHLQMCVAWYMQTSTTRLTPLPSCTPGCGVVCRYDAVRAIALVLSGNGYTAQVPKVLLLVIDATAPTGPAPAAGGPAAAAAAPGSSAANHPSAGAAAGAAAAGGSGMPAPAAAAGARAGGGVPAAAAPLGMPGATPVSLPLPLDLASLRHLAVCEGCEVTVSLLRSEAELLAAFAATVQVCRRGELLGGNKRLLLLLVAGPCQTRGTPGWSCVWFQLPCCCMLLLQALLWHHNPECRVAGCAQVTSTLQPSKAATVVRWTHVQCCICSLCGLLLSARRLAFIPPVSFCLYGNPSPPLPDAHHSHTRPPPLLASGVGPRCAGGVGCAAGVPGLPGGQSQAGRGQSATGGVPHSTGGACKGDRGSRGMWDGSRASGAVRGSGRAMKGNRTAQRLWARRYGRPVHAAGWGCVGPGNHSPYVLCCG